MADEFNATMEKGKAFYLERKFKEALTLFRQAAKMRPQLFAGHYFAGRAMEGLEMLEKAIEEYTIALGISPTSNAALICRGRARVQLALKAHCMDDETVKEIIGDYDKAIEVNPDYYWPYYEKAMVYFFLSRLDEAWPLFDQALSKEPLLDTGELDHEAYLRAGICLGLIGERKRDIAKLYRANALLGMAYSCPDFMAEVERWRNYFKTVLKSLEGIL